MSSKCFEWRLLLTVDVIFFQVQDLGEHVRYWELGEENPPNIRSSAEVSEFLSSSQKHLSLGMHCSCFPSEASGNCHILRNLFYLFIYFF